MITEDFSEDKNPVQWKLLQLFEKIEEAYKVDYFEWARILQLFYDCLREYIRHTIDKQRLDDLYKSIEREHEEILFAPKNLKMQIMESFKPKVREFHKLIIAKFVVRFGEISVSATPISEDDMLEIE